MQIFVPKETAPGETRVPIVPSTVAKLVKLGQTEAVGSIAPVSKPAIEGKGYEELMAENAALRAQLKTGVHARRAPGGRRQTVVPRA